MDWRCHTGTWLELLRKTAKNLARAVCVPTEVRTWPGQYVFLLMYERFQGSMCSYWSTNLARAVCVPTEVRTWPGQYVFLLMYELGQGSMCSYWSSNLARAICVPTDVRTWPGQYVFPLKYELGQDPVCPQQYEPTPREYMYESLPLDPTYFVSSGI